MAGSWEVREKAYALLPKVKAENIDFNEGGHDKFTKTLSRSAALLQQPDTPKGAANDEGSDGDDSDQEDELHNFEVEDVASGSVGSGRERRSYRLYKDIGLVRIPTEREALDKMIQVKGGFVQFVLYPWWQLTLHLKESKNTTIKQLKEPPLVEIRRDKAIDCNMVYLFLRKCSVETQHIAILHQYILSRNLYLNFSNLYDILDSENAASTLKLVSPSIKAQILNSDQGKLFHCKNLAKYCSALFPRDTGNILASMTLPELMELDTMIKEEPWHLGYMVKTKDYFGMKGIEVKLKSFIESKLLYTMPKEMQDALYVYNGIKNITYHEGHTYVPVQQMFSRKLYYARVAVEKRSMSNKDIVNAIDYLTGQNILEKDALSSGEDILSLPHIKEYEVSIGRNISALMSGSPHLPKNAVVETDFGDDQDQLKAAKMMTEKPVTVLSGPGGCGKTFVVSKLLSRVVIKCPIHSEKAKNSDKDPSQRKELDGEMADDSLREFVSQNVDLSSEDKQCIGADHVQGKSVVNTATQDTSSASDISTEAESIATHESLRASQSVGDDCVFDDECLITAPTGRAAVIIGRRSGVAAYTMHQVLYSYIRYCRIEPKPEEGWRFKDVRVLICDECSLISVRLFSMLSGILLRHAKLSQIILLGDVNQLPSIEPGNFLADVFHILKSHSAAIRLTVNHRAESELIINNAREISRQLMPVFDIARGFVPVCINNENELAIHVQDLLKSTERHLKEIGGKKGDHVSQFIAFRRKDCDLINELCCQHYAKHATLDEKNRRNFQIGDKICATRNRDVFDMEQKAAVRVTNGEIFFLRDDRTIEDRGKKDRFWIIDDLERQLKIDYKEIRKLRFKHAYARTIHTYQGSESEIIIYVVGKPWYQTCQHVYTAITRGKRQAVVVFDDSSLGRSVASPPKKRDTRLRFYLTQSLKSNGMPIFDVCDDEDAWADLDKNDGEKIVLAVTGDCVKESRLLEEDPDDDFFCAIDEDILTPMEEGKVKADRPKKGTNRPGEKSKRRLGRGVIDEEISVQSTGRRKTEKRKLANSKRKQGSVKRKETKEKDLDDFLTDDDSNDSFMSDIDDDYADVEIGAMRSSIVTRSRGRGTNGKAGTSTQILDDVASKNVHVSDTVTLNEPLEFTGSANVTKTPVVGQKQRRCKTPKLP